MTTLSAFADLVLGFVPFFGIALAIVTALWAATKLFPSFGEMVSDVFDGLFGVDDDYDEKYQTGYTPSNRWK